MSEFARYPSLRDRVVLVTGGASGIGGEMVRQFASQGSRVVFLDVDDGAAEHLISSFRAEDAHQPIYRHCDLHDVPQLQAEISAIGQSLGPVAVLVNNAANDRRQDFEKTSVEEFEWSMQINFRHQYFAIQAVLPMMRELGRGSIVNLSSIAWMGGGPELVAYAAAKAAVVGMTSSLAKKLGPLNIRVNAIAPGAVMTERQLTLWYDDASAAAMVERQCLPHRLREEEVARMALFLAADDSRMITKQCFVVDAGLR